MKAGLGLHAYRWRRAAVWRNRMSLGERARRNTRSRDLFCAIVWRMSTADVRAAVSASAGALERLDAAAWGRRAPLVGWTVADTVGHIVGALGSYATLLSIERIASNPLPIVVRPRDSVQPDGLLTALEGAGELLAATVERADPNVWVTHPWGRADRTAIAAMGCDETLIHTWDACRAAAFHFRPADDVCRTVLDRLFPWAPTDTDPWETLLWANGRRRLGERSRLPQRWRWYSSDLSTWDGRGPKVGGPHGELVDWHGQ